MNTHYVQLQIRRDLIKLEIKLNPLTPKLSESCYSRDTPGGSTRGPYKVCDNLHSIARIKAEMPF